MAVSSVSYVQGLWGCRGGAIVARAEAAGRAGARGLEARAGLALEFADRLVE